MSHTPTPWVFDYEATGGHIKSLGIPKPDGQDWKPTPTVCRYDDEMCLQPLIAHTISKDERRANAAFICEAVNNHDRLTAEVGRLREICKEFLAWHQKYPPGRVYSYYVAPKIEAELTSIMEKAAKALNPEEQP